MATEEKKQETVKPRLLKGFRDIFSAEYLARRWMVETVRKVYERYGFVPIETPALEYVDVIGKYLPDCDKAEEGIFAFRDSDQSWVALRYDLTAPLSRLVAQYPNLPHPFRRYQLGLVWRDEKPGLGRFREFYQFDIDTVGSASMAADAEVCMVICDALQALGFAKGEYLVKINNRKVLNGVLELAGIPPVDDKGEFTAQALTTLRAVDKLDRLGFKGVAELLGPGRRDESGDFTRGAGLTAEAIALIEKYLGISGKGREEVLRSLAELVATSPMGQEGVAELREMCELLSAVGYDSTQVTVDPTVVRGLSYYTGPVFETVLTVPCRDEHGEPRQFGSIFGGGRYDSLVERFLGEKMPATGVSCGLDRLLEAMRLLGRIKTPKATSQVLITTMDKSLMAHYQKITHDLRRAGIACEMFLGQGNIKKQLKYADQWDIPLAIIIGSNEMARQEVTIKDLRKGRELASKIEDRETWKKAEQIQVTVPLSDIFSKVQEMLKI
jgi:histidyl-tRNA synthetase